MSSTACRPALPPRDPDWDGAGSLSPGRRAARHHSRREHNRGPCHRGRDRGDYFTQRDKLKVAQRLARRLKDLGYDVDLRPSAA